jgi:MFS superfamily sulfate permease-like transporter
MLYGSIFLFGLALISLSMALTTLFTDSKLSPQVGMYLLMLPTSIFFFMISQRISIFGNSDTLAYRLFPLTYIMPNFSFSVIMLEFYIKGGP